MDHFHGNGHMLCIFFFERRQIQTMKRKRVNTLIFAMKLLTELIIRTKNTDIHEASFVILKI